MNGEQCTNAARIEGVKLKMQTVAANGKEIANGQLSD
jgi:hypothetical protein